MNKDYYQEILEKIKSLINQKSLKEAQEILSEELRMPYIPSKYESQFFDLQDEIISNLTPDDSKSIKTIALETILEMIEDESSSDEIALEVLGKHNLRQAKDRIKLIIESINKEDSIKRSYLFELLAEQEIDISIKIDGKILNPIKDSILSNEEVKKSFLKAIEITEREIQIKEHVINELRRYFLKVFPNKIENGEFLAFNMYCIIKNMFDPDYELSNAQLELKEFMSS